ncbi:hypothetical protein B4U79_09718 [Dinothrombium tinctorium]|uniref:Dynactin subunit 6 n=1 Tax=Dinothrombium tinctorium TaxID=1965070 RepID=A0A3S3RSU1_9ACAR|nr:hypothetical protein B4U79_09718 [Dinothrombium tinctorium]
MGSEPNVKIGNEAIVCAEHTVIEGDVKIGCKTIVHPTVKIIAKNGPIVIGDFNLIEEYSTIINKSEETMIIGNYNVFEVGSYSESLKIGDYNVIEYKARLSKNTLLKNGCVIGAKCVVDWDQTLDDNVVVYGPDCKTRIQSEKPIAQTMQLEFLSKIMPNYQPIRKPNWKLEKAMAKSQ